MHILLTNDDGPPSPHSSPYIRCLVDSLQKAGHTVSVCLPHTQRSWIGKAHMIGQTVKPLYYRPSEAIYGEEAQGTTHFKPSRDGNVEEWILVDGTPASCVQIGLHHFFQERGPIDLVVSGPNYGRNSTAVFALSSGTLGAALEAAACGQKAIALSFAFFSRNHDPVIIDGACRHSVRVIEALYKQWPQDRSVDLYTVNVPLVEGVEEHKTVWTEMLQNYWTGGSCFQEVEGSIGDEDEEEERIREGVTGEVAAKPGKDPKPSSVPGHTHKHFKWAPRFGDVYKSVEDSGPGSDGWEVKEGNTSITPLKANFWQAATHLHGKELELPPPAPRPDVLEIPGTGSVQHLTGKTNSTETIYAIVAYEDPYVQPLILDAISSLFPNINVLSTLAPTSNDGEPNLGSYLPTPAVKVLNITSYEAIDFSFAQEHRQTCLINSYAIRKALIRKHFLSTTVDIWVSKRPGSVLREHVKRSEAFEVDYAEFLDDALVEAWDLRESMEKNEEGQGHEEDGETVGSRTGGDGNGGNDDDDDDGGGEGKGAEEKSARHREWWILKPSMSDRGQGIRLFSTMAELQSIFDGWEEDMPSSDDEDEDDDAHSTDATGGDETGDHITTSHLRHFVAQPYIHPPLLVNGRKFHIRTYVLCNGRLDVYVYRQMLALFAAKDYAAPWEEDDLDKHLTNTCLQGPGSSPSSVQLWNALPIDDILKTSVEQQIFEVVGDLFEAAAMGMPIHFQPLGNGFEVYGLDFLVDQAGMTWLLEVNAFPDFKQTGGQLKRVVAGFWEEVVRVSVGSFFGVEPKAGSSGSRSGAEAAGDEKKKEEDLVLVRKIDLPGM